MKAQDWMSQDNNRANAIAKLIAFCDAHGYEYKYTEKEFRVPLPDVEPVPVVPISTRLNVQRGRRRKSFDTSTWGEASIDESDLPTELPPTETPLDEGEAPKGDDEV